MIRRRIKRTSLNVSLFPFLAVLICTLGVLIVLLVLAVRSAEMQALEDRETHQEDREAEEVRWKQLQSELDDTEVKIELIESNRPDRLALLSQSREYRGHLESEIRNLKDRARQLDETLASFDRQQPIESDSPAVPNQIEALKQAVLLAEKDLEQKRHLSKANDKVTYSIIPHEGAGGTFRRPIFIVCSKGSVTIEPLGIRLEKQDFVAPLGPGNPLDAAVLAIREYWQRHDLNGSNGNPYPLIVIRPDGAEGYAISRRAMSSWEDEFGYELVEADKELDFGPVDEQLKKVVETAIAEAKVRQRTMLAARTLQQAAVVQQASFRNARGAGTRDSNSRPGLTASGSGGGFVVNSAWDEFDQGDFGSPSSSGSGDRLGGSLGSNGDLSGGGGFSEAKPVGTRSGSKHDLITDSSTMARNSEYQGDSEQGQLFRRAKANQPGKTTDSGQLSNQSTLGSSNPSSQSSSSQRTSQANGADAAGKGAGADASGTDCNPMYQHLNMAKTKGRNWAVPNKQPNATAYVRPIRVVCMANELEVRSTLGVEKRIPIGNDIAESVDPLVNEIWRQIESWGIPGERSYWKPELRISVVAGGELNFEKLQGLLLDSGISIKETAQ